MVVEQTDVSRVLVSKQRASSSGDRAAMAMYLAGVGEGRDIQLRASSDPDVHDRFVANSTSVWMLGHSLNGVAARLGSTVMIEMPAPGAAAQRSKIEQWWTEADRIEPASPQPEPEGLERTEAVEPARSRVTEIVRHRTDPGP